ncbi:MAG TPA: hypothetical protein VH349_19300 [Ktedonobacterales bacterium]
MYLLSHTKDFTKAVRAALIVMGIVSLVAAAGFALSVSPFTEIWPLGDSAAVNRFLGAYLAGIGASLLWIGVSGDLGAAVAGAISLTVVYASLAIAWLMLPLGTAEPRLRPAAFLWMGGALVSVGLAFWFRRFPLQDTQPLPRTVSRSFVVFVLLLAFVGGALLLRTPNIFPLPLGPGAAAVIGSAFLGSTAYFLYSLRFPLWRNACAPLWGFLAYDLALIVPLVSHLSVVDAAHRLALIINIAVLIFSGGLAICYLLIVRATRVWSLYPAQVNQQPLKIAVATVRKTVSQVRARFVS